MQTEYGGEGVNHGSATPPAQTPQAPHGSGPEGGRRIAAPPPRKPRLFTSLIWAVVFGLIVVAIVVFAHMHASSGGGGKGKGGHGGRFGDLATTVSVATVAKGSVPINLSELGTVTPLATVTVTSQVSGYLQSVGFKEGQLVRKGQFLAQIDPRPYQAQLLQAQGAYARDEASLAEAQLDLKRYQLLLSQDSISRQTVDQQAALVKQDEGTLATDRASIRTAQLDVAYAHVTSPVTGRAGLRQIDVGNYVTAVSNVPNAPSSSTSTSSGIVVVTQLTPMDVEFTLPEDDLPQVQARLRAGGTLPVVAYDRTGTIELARGELFALDSFVDVNTGTVKAKARFDNGTGALFPLQFVNVKLLVDTLSDAVVAPNTAVLRGADGLYAYKVQGKPNAHTVTIANVKTGASDGVNTVILSGLKVGDVLVTDGADRLKEGAQVILPGDCIPAGGFGGKGGHGRHGHGGGGSPGGHGAAGGPPGQGGCPKGETPAGKAPGGGSSANAGASGASATPGAASGSSEASGGAPGQPQGQGQQEAGGQRQAARLQQMLATLNLDAAQQLKAQALFTTARGDAMTAAAQAGDDPDARRQAMRNAYAKAFDQLEPSLRPDQKAKLAQLRAQMQSQHGGGQ